MKYLPLIIPLLVAACHPGKYCTVNSRYLKKVDITHSFRLKSVYCITAARDTTVANGNSVVRFNVFDRIHGRIISDIGIAFYGKDTTKTAFHESPVTISTQPGTYRTSIFAVGYEELYTPALTLKPNQVTTINVFLGTRVDY